jgi:hypothetical protein
MPDLDSTKITHIRLIYEKRGGACFVPHVALSAVFARAARRAGMELSGTEGFSPRARMSFGPELPAGVVALNEPGDLWLKTPEEITAEGRRDFLEYVTGALNAQMPEGFRVTKCLLPAEGSPALGRECRAAHYLVWTGNGLSEDADKLLSYMNRCYGEAVLDGFVEQVVFCGFSRVSAVIANPAQNGIGILVKALVADGVVAGWHETRIVRTGLGRWNGKQMESMEEGAACFKA